MENLLSSKDEIKGFQKDLDFHSSEIKKVKISIKNIKAKNVKIAKDLQEGLKLGVDKKEMDTLMEELLNNKDALKDLENDWDYHYSELDNVKGVVSHKQDENAKLEKELEQRLEFEIEG